jgi:DNA-binding transcriptional LysR family regulator
VTAPALFGRLHLAPLATEFVTRFPHARIERLLVDRVVILLEEGIDLAVRIAHLPDSSLIAVTPGQIRRVVCAAPLCYDAPTHHANPGARPPAGGALQRSGHPARMGILGSGPQTHGRSRGPVRVQLGRCGDRRLSASIGVRLLSIVSSAGASCCRLASSKLPSIGLSPNPKSPFVPAFAQAAKGSRYGALAR